MCERVLGYARHAPHDPTPMPDILVIDDDAAVRHFVRDVLAPRGHTVRSAGDGEAGLRAFRERPADLVVCDIFMPEAEGLETIRALRRLAPTVPIIAAGGGGHGAISFLPHAVVFGANAVLDKPIRPGDLLACVAQLTAAG